MQRFMLGLNCLYVFARETTASGQVAAALYRESA